MSSPISPVRRYLGGAAFLGLAALLVILAVGALANAATVHADVQHRSNTIDAQFYIVLAWRLAVLAVIFAVAFGAMHVYNRRRNVAKPTPAALATVIVIALACCVGAFLARRTTAVSQEWQVALTSGLQAAALTLLTAAIAFVIVRPAIRQRRRATSRRPRVAPATPRRTAPRGARR